MSTTWINRGHFYTPHVTPVLADCNFKVDSTNPAGITGLKGQAVARVFMNSSASFVGATHTSTLVDAISDTSILSVGMPVQGSNIAAGTVIAAIIDSVSITLSIAATGSGATDTITYQAVGSPNPQAGTIMLQLADNFSRMYGFNLSIAAPLSGSSILVASAGVTRGLVYTITILGTTTTAGWVSLGLPPGITPAVGVSFVAKITATAAGTGAVQVPATNGSDIDHVESAGDPSLILQPAPAGGSPNVGGFIILNCYEEGVLAAPADGSLLYIEAYMNQSSVLVKGE